MKQQEYQFTHTAQPSYESAVRVVPRVIELLGVPECVVDLGGGCGSWMRAFQEAGVRRVLCIDHPSVRREELLIAAGDFVACDLDVHLPAFVPADLAVSIEFAEHLDMARAREIVRWLCQCAPCVLFSAAIPRQSGNGHLNEQWADYWRELFASESFQQFDAVRPAIIFDREIFPWLRQNLFLYARTGSAAARVLATRTRPIVPTEFEIVEKRTLHRPPTVTELLRQFPRALRSAIAHRIG